MKFQVFTSLYPTEQQATWCSIDGGYGLPQEEARSPDGSDRGSNPSSAPLGCWLLCSITTTTCAGHLGRATAAMAAPAAATR